MINKSFDEKSFDEGAIIPFLKFDSSNLIHAPLFVLCACSCSFTPLPGVRDDICQLVSWSATACERSTMAWKTMEKTHVTQGKSMRLMSEKRHIKKTFLRIRSIIGIASNFTTSTERIRNKNLTLMLPTLPKARLTSSEAQFQLQ